MQAWGSWIPNFSRFREATEDMQFDVRRVIFKDYTTIATTISALAVTEAYEYLAMPPALADLDYEVLLGVIVLLCGIGTLLIRTVKKSRPHIR